MKKLIYLILLLFILASCGSLKQTDSKILDIKSKVTQYPTLVDLEVQKESISGSVEWKKTIFSRDIPLEVRIGNLIADMTNKAKADILVEPRFTLEKGSSGWRSKKITIIGYPASYKNFRPATAEDIEVLKALNKREECTDNTKHAKTYRAKIIKRSNGFTNITSRLFKKK